MSRRVSGLRVSSGCSFLDSIIHVSKSGERAREPYISDRTEDLGRGRSSMVEQNAPSGGLKRTQEFRCRRPLLTDGKTMAATKISRRTFSGSASYSLFPIGGDSRHRVTAC